MGKDTGLTSSWPWLTPGVVGWEDHEQRRGDCSAIKMFATQAREPELRSLEPMPCERGHLPVIPASEGRDGASLEQAG